MIIIDTDVLIEWLDRKSSKSKDKIEECLTAMNEELVTTSLNLEEILFGFFKRNKTTSLARDHPLLRLRVLPFHVNDAVIAAKLEYEMEKRGEKKPRGDLLIAAITINHNAKLFTFNKKHYDGIPTLQVFKC